MTATIVEKWARTLTGYSVQVKPGQTVAILGDVAAEPLLRAIYREVVKRGAFPLMLPGFTGTRADLLKFGNDDQLTFINPVEQFIQERADVMIHVLANTNTRSLSGVDPTRLVMFQKARTHLYETFTERETKGLVDWTLTLYPTDATAQDAEMSTSDFFEFVTTACKLDADDPVAAWQEQAKEQQRLIDWLAGKSAVKIVAPGTDLRLSIQDRKWINCDGRKNFPDGEIFTGPVEPSVDGTISFTYPAIYAGREVAGVQLTFKDGEVTRASAEKGEDLLIATLDIDEGARRLGEFAFGTNFAITRFVKEMLFDEKIGGTVHMAVGSGLPETGSVNTSTVHWDMLLDLRRGGTVTVDGQPFLVDGKYVV